MADSSSKSTPSRPKSTASGRSPSGRPPSGRSPVSPRPVVTVLVSSQARAARPLGSALAIGGVLLGSTALVTGGIWLALQLIINPGSVSWLGRFLPEWSHLTGSGQSEPVTLAEIRAEAEQAGLWMAESLSLDPVAGNGPDLLIPLVSHRSHCQSFAAVASGEPPAGCGQIVELRAYRPKPIDYAANGQRHYDLLDQIAVAGPEEFFVIAPLMRSRAANSGMVSQGSARDLPLEHIDRIAGQSPGPGIWLNLSGERVRGSSRILYGTVVRFDADRDRLQTLMEWTSPAAKLPRWQAVIQGESSQLVVDQTLGLEPHLQVYQVRSRRSPTPFQLEPISLTEPAIRDLDYENALFLARNGLWSPALKTLQALQPRYQTSPSAWTPEAQAQLDLIALHAQVTQTQADQDWASPAQKLLSQLIDGRWTEALQLLQTELTEESALMGFLNANFDRLWNRVDAALRANPDQPDVQVWGALAITADQGRAQAIAWLKQQPNPSETLNSRVQQVLNRLNRPAPQPLLTPVSAPTATEPAQAIASRATRILGSASPLANVNPSDWLRSDSAEPLELGDRQSWYQVQVAQFHDGTNWRRSPFTTLSLPASGADQFLWNLLSLSQNSPLQIIISTPSGQTQLIEATIQAVQFKNGTLNLLAAGDTVLPAEFPTAQAPRPLALTPATLQWVSAPQTQTLQQLSQQQPDWIVALMPNLWQELQQAQVIVPVTVSQPEEMLQELGNWSVQLIDLTGNSHPEAILTFSPELLSATRYSNLNAPTQSAPISPARTLIFSDQGTLIYSELSDQSGQSVVAIADTQDTTPSLLINTPNNYILQRWAAQGQQFE